MKHGKLRLISTEKENIMATAPKKLPPWLDKAEKKEGKKEPKESTKMKRKEHMMGMEKYKSGGKVKRGKC